MYTVIKTSGWVGDTWREDSEHETRKAALDHAAKIHQPDARRDACITAVIGAVKPCSLHEFCVIGDTSRVQTITDHHLRSRKCHIRYDPYEVAQ